jgi:hypothetical protein
MERIQRCLDYLYKLDERKSLLCHNVNMNSSFCLQLVRSADRWYMIMLRRLKDNCLLHTITLSNECSRDVAAELMKALETLGDRPRCAICNQVSTDSVYCELCGVMQTEVEETCSICLDEDRRVAVWVETDCGHCYHHECLSKVQERCPMCRATLGKTMKII